ncbi:MAG: hypothetical protein AAGJ79_11590 [Verrucomicrobiota bacterium]
MSPLVRALLITAGLAVMAVLGAFLYLNITSEKSPNSEAIATGGFPSQASPPTAESVNPGASSPSTGRETGPDSEPEAGSGRGNPLAPEPIPLNLDGPAFERLGDDRVLKKDVVAMARDLHDPEQDPVEDVQILKSLVGAYREIFRENPIAGENWEVVEALTGRNKYRMVFIEPTHPAIDENGELRDRWKVPYRFHPISKDRMDILSAGEDQQFGTGDDIMVDEPADIDQGSRR